jgi:hypothetical protein
MKLPLASSSWMLFISDGRADIEVLKTCEKNPYPSKISR